MNKLQKSVLLATTALSLAAPVAVRAADSVVAAGQEQIEQVVVTAQRREQRLQDVPISITVFNQQQLSNHNVVNAMDLAKYTPSLGVNTNFGSQNTSFAIRGFAQDIGTAPSVGVYFADVLEPHAPSQGIQVGDGAGAGDFFDLQNVQVLKGVQGTLFGRNTTGGDILLVPQKPTDEFNGYVQGSFGNYNMKGGQGVINIPVNDDIRLRFGVDHESRDGYVINNSGFGPKDFDDVDYTALRFSADIDLTPDLNNYTIASYGNSDTNGDFQRLIACDPAAGLGQVGLCGQLTGKLADPKGPNSFQGSGFYDGAQPLADAYQKQVEWRVINTTTWQESDNLTIKNIASYSQIKFNAANPLFGVNPANSLVTSVFPKIPEFTITEVTPAPGLPFADQANYTEEMQALGNALDNRLTWQVGGYLEGDTPLSLTGAQSANASSCVNLSALQCWDPLGTLGGVHHGSVNFTVGETWDNDYALYTQETYKITDQLSVTGGYRYTWDRQANTSTQLTQDTAFVDIGGVMQPPGIVGRNCTNPEAPGYIKATVNPLGHGLTPFPLSECTLSFYSRSNAPTWLLESDYKPTDDIMLYAKWARGYRQGVLSANITAPYNVAGPEKDDDYEVGAKTSWAYNDITGTFDIDGFYNDFRNQQLLIGFIPNPTYLCASAANPVCAAPVSPTAVPVNAGKSVLDGVEVDASIVPYEGLSFQVGYTYLNAVVLSTRNIGNPVGGLYVVSGGISPGDEIELSPKNKIALTGSYVLPVDDSIGKITVSSTFTHTASQVTNYIDRQLPYFTGIGVDGRIQPTNLLDLNLNWEQIMGHPLDLSIFATNVTNDKYYTWVPGVAQFAGIETASLGEPQMYGVRITVHFGQD